MMESLKAGPDVVQPRIQSVARAVRVLEVIAKSTEGLTAVEIAAELNLNRATVYHLVHTLGSVGYVVQGPERRFRLALGLGRLVEGFERQVTSTDFLPLVRALADKTGETAYVAARQGSRFVLLCSVPGHHPVGVATSDVGPIEAGHARASGKLLLALAPEEVRDAYLAVHPLTRFTDATITDDAVLRAELAEIVEAGYATEEGEHSTGVSCIAVPLASGPYALALSAPHDRFRTNFAEYLAVARALASGA